MSASVHSRKIVHSLHWSLITFLSAAALFVAVPACAEDGPQLEVRLGPFHATGEWTVTGASIEGKGQIKLRGDAGIAITATYDTERRTGRWQGTFSMPLLGQTKASGQITERALLFSQKVDVGAGTATFQFVLTPDRLIGEGQGTLKAGKVSFGRVGLKYEDGDMTANSAARIRLPGLSTPMDATLHFRDGLFESATGSGKVVLGSYAFQAEALVKLRGDVTLTATASQTLPGIGAVDMKVLYENGQVSATGTRTVSLGSLAFDNTIITLDKSGKIGLSKTSSVDLPGIGTTQLVLNYANNRLTASGSRQIKLGGFAFDNTSIMVDSAGTISVAKQASVSIPGLGSTQMALSYANGVLSASGSRDVSLGSFMFSNTAVAISSNGTISLSKSQSVNIPGLGSTQMALSYANGVLSASGSRDVSLGSFMFSNTAVAISSNGTISLSKSQSVNIPGLGSTQMALSYANGVLSASGSRDVSLGSFMFSNTAVAISSNGTISLSKSQSVNIPGLGSTQMALSYANGVLSASGSRDVSLGSFMFSNTAVAISSNGTISLSKSQSVNIPGLGSTQMALSYANGVLSASGSRDVSLGSFMFSNTAVAISSNGTISLSKSQSVNIPGLGSTQMALSYANGVLSASGSRDVSLGSFMFSNTAVAISSNGTISLSKSQSVNIPGLGSTQMALSYANGVLSASGSRDVSLGSFMFSNTAVAISSNGTISLSKSQSVNIPGLGSTQMALSYANGVLSASGSRDVSLGSFMFSNTAVAISSNGTISLSKSQSVNIPGLGSTQMALSYANGVLSASGSRDVSLGSFMFSNTAVAISSNGTISLSKSQSVSIPGIGFTQLTLGYANGEVVANGTASITVSVLSHSLNFGTAAVHVSSSGTVSVSASQGINIGPLHYNVSITYENGSIKVHY